MAFLDILSSAAGGGLFGSLLHLGSSLVETWQKKKQAEVEIMLMQAKVAAAEKEAAWHAFAKSQEGGAAKGLEIPATAPRWVVAVYLLVDAFRNFTRPGITWALLGVVVYVFAVSPQPARDGMLQEITFCAFTAFFWWFGSRYTRK